MRGHRCSAPVLDAEKRASICGKPATAQRVLEGVALDFCSEHVAVLEREEQAKVVAKWDAEQAKLPAHKRRTWDQAVADEDAAYARALRRSIRKGGP